MAVMVQLDDLLQRENDLPRLNEIYRAVFNALAAAEPRRTWGCTTPYWRMGWKYADVLEEMKDRAGGGSVRAKLDAVVTPGESRLSDVRIGYTDWKLRMDDWGSSQGTKLAVSFRVGIFNLSHLEPSAIPSRHRMNRMSPKFGASAGAHRGGAVAGGPVDEEGAAEHEAAGTRPAWTLQVPSAGRSIGIVPVAGVAADQRVVAEHEILVLAEVHDRSGQLDRACPSRAGRAAEASAVDVVDVAPQADVRRPRRSGWPR